MAPVSGGGTNTSSTSGGRVPAGNPMAYAQRNNSKAAPTQAKNRFTPTVRTSLSDLVSNLPPAGADRDWYISKLSPNQRAMVNKATDGGLYSVKTGTSKNNTDRESIQESTQGSVPGPRGKVVAGAETQQDRGTGYPGDRGILRTDPTTGQVLMMTREGPRWMLRSEAETYFKNNPSGPGSQMLSQEELNKNNEQRLEDNKTYLDNQKEQDKNRETLRQTYLHMSPEDVKKLTPAQLRQYEWMVGIDSKSPYYTNPGGTKPGEDALVQPGGGVKYGGVHTPELPASTYKPYTAPPVQLQRQTAYNTEGWNPNAGLPATNAPVNYQNRDFKPVMPQGGLTQQQGQQMETLRQRQMQPLAVTRTPTPDLTAARNIGQKIIAGSGGPMSPSLAAKYGQKPSAPASAPAFMPSTSDWRQAMTKG